MAVQFNNSLLDKYFAPGISVLKTLSVPDLTGKIPEAEHWLSNHFLNNILGDHYVELWRKMAIVFLFRAQNAVREYNFARNESLNFIERSTEGRPATSTYFRAVFHWENVIHSLHLAVDVLDCAKMPDFDPGEDGALLRQMANRIKHVGEDIADNLHGEDLTIPMWMTENGLETRVAKMTFATIAENVLELGKAADIMANPRSQV